MAFLILRLATAILMFFWFVHGVATTNLATVIISSLGMMACAIAWEQG